LGVRLLPKAIDAYSKKFPNVQLQVILADQYLDFTEDEIDLALRVLSPQDSSLIARKLSSNPVSFYASPLYITKNKIPKTVEDLKNHKVYCIGIHLKLKFLKSKMTLQNVIPQPSILCTNGDLLVELACQGHGILIRSEWGVEKEVNSGHLIKIELDDSLVSDSDIYLVYPKHKYTHPRIKALIEILLKLF